MLIPWLEWSVVFSIGLLGGFLCAKLWRWLQVYIELRRAAAALAALNLELIDDPRDRAAQSRVEACKQRLRWQLDLNPDWFSPLINETPVLVRDIAAIYYPDAEDPLRAPGLSHFIRAIHLTAADMADFLQTHRLGRLVDVSVNTLWKGWEMGRKVAGHEGVKTLHKWYQQARPWYKRALPIWQVARYQSPWMWVGFTLSNVMIRTVQPIIIDIIARRAIDLYSGRLAMQAAKPAEDWDDAAAG